MVTLFILLVVFNVGIHWQIEKESISAIEQNLMYYKDDNDLDYLDGELYNEETGLYAAIYRINILFCSNIHWHDWKYHRLYPRKEIGRK